MQPRRAAHGAPPEIVLTSTTFAFSPGTPAVARGRGVTAVLGPTNTGKTHLAIERMLGHESGLIGLPLRLLAREVYGRVVDRAGVEQVALVTGEEKIIPARPRYWVSTVEAMPRDLDVSFVAIDEIQLASDLDRGHVFTERLLSMRGRNETLILGAATMRGLVERLLPGVSIVSRARLSTLTFAGEKKITRLPRRSAVVAFSADEVYAIAELIRRQRGGAAVVLGALSPRTRNAQVALYQSGEVDYLVATDAIGMGLNLDVDHVAFASDRKFDGFQFRRLNPAEFAQIAGRAGRHMRDGTFGSTGRCPPLESELVQRLESHNFDAVRVLQWRNPELDFGSLARLQDSLAVAPRETGLTRAPGGDDIAALEHAARDPEVRALATSPRAVEKLWEVCQIPDYRRIAPAQHAELITTLYGFVAGAGTIPSDWFAREIAATDRTDGDIDTLSRRIAHIRTWTFVANRPDWLDDPVHWQETTRAIEDKLSDALHERLTQRFVDRRTSVLMRRLREKDMLEAEITPDGEVRVEGHLLGRLSAFQFVPDPGADAEERKALQAAAAGVLAGEIGARAQRFSTAGDGEIVLAADGVLRWQGAVVGRLIKGDKVLAPRVRLVADELLNGPARESAERRLELWIKAHIEKLLGPLTALETAPDLEGMARGIAFQLAEGLGVLDRARVAADVRALDQDARASLRKHGIRFGAYHLYLPALLKPAPRALAAELWTLHHGNPEEKGASEVSHLAASGRTSIPVDKEVPKGIYRTLGYKVCGERAVRIDILERLADQIRPAVAYRPGVSPGEPPPGAAEGDAFTVTVGMMSLVGCSGEDFASVLRSLGYRMERKLVPPETPRPSAPEAATAANEGDQADAATPTPMPEPAEAETAAEGVEAPAEVAEEAEAPAVAAAAGDVLADEAMPADVAGPEPEVLAAHPEPEVAAEAPLQAPVATSAETDADAGAEGAVSPPAEPVPAETSETIAASDGETASPSPVAEAIEAAAPDAQAAPDAAAPPAEPVFREIWRLARHEERSRDNRRRPPRREAGDAGRHGQARPPAGDGQQPPPEPAGDRQPREARGGEPHRQHQQRRGDRPRRPEQAERPRHDRPERHGGDRPERHGGDRSDRHGGPRGERQGGDHRPERQAGPPRPQRKPEQRGPDPDSPFAALLQLKEALEAREKGKR